MFAEKELYYIFKMFFPEGKNVYVLDPGKKMVKRHLEAGFKYVRVRKDVEDLAKSKKRFYLINLSGAGTFSFPFDAELVEGVISFNGYTETSMDFYHHELYYMRDKGQNLKWLLSEKYRNVDFLLNHNEYESVIDIGNMFDVFPKSIKMLRVALGGLKGVANGKIQVLKKEREIFKGLDLKAFQSYSVNLQGAMQNEIMSLNLKKNGKLRSIYKVPVTTEAGKVLKQENQLLQNLNEQYFKYLEIPKQDFKDPELKVDFNIPFKKTGYYTLQKKLNDNFIRALGELGEKSLDTVRVEEILRAEETVKVLSYIKIKLSNKTYPHGFGVMNFVKVYKELTDTLNGLDISRKIPSSIFNNFLVPEFIGHGSGKMLFLNWENAEIKYPLLFDLFEYTFRYVERLEQADVDYLLNDIKALKESPGLQTLYKIADIDFDLHLKLFMLVRCAKEMIAYFEKKAIQPEANMKVYLWGEFLSRYKLRSNQE